MERPLVRQLKERENAAQALIKRLGREACGDKDHVIEIRANKRGLARRKKELLAAERSLYQEHELVAVDMAIKALKTTRGAAIFRKRLTELSIRIVGGIAGGTGSGESSEYAVIPVPRKRKAPKSLAKIFDSKCEVVAEEQTGGVVELDIPVLKFIPETWRLKDLLGGVMVTGSIGAGKTSGTKVQRRARKTGTRKHEPPKSR